MWPTENRRNRALFRPTKQKRKISAASQTVATAQIAPKISRGHPQQCTQSAPGFIQIGSLWAEL